MTGTAVTTSPTVSPAARHAERPETRTIWRGATIVASVLLATGIVIGISGLLSLAALALLGALSAAVAAVKERPRSGFGWLLASLSGVALATVTIASIIARP